MLCILLYNNNVIYYNIDNIVLSICFQVPVCMYLYMIILLIVIVILIQYHR